MRNGDKQIQIITDPDEVKKIEKEARRRMSKEKTELSMEVNT